MNTFNRRKPMKIKRIILSFLVLLLSVSTLGSASKPAVIKIASLAPEGSSWVKIFNDFNEELKKKTLNEVQLKIYPGGVLGDEKDMIRKMYVGQIQGAVLTSAGLSSIFSEMDVFQIPFLFKSYDEVDYVLEKMEGFFRKGFEDNGYVLAAFTEGGFVRLMSTIPIASLDDLKKAKVWTWEDAPMARAIFEAANVSAIPLSLPDVLVGLQTGLVEVVYAPPTGAIALQWFTKTKYMTDVPVIYLIGAILVKKDIFDKLPPAHQQVFMELSAKYMDQLKRVIRDENQEAIQVMIRHGVKLVKPSAGQVEEFIKLSREAMLHQIGKSFSQKIKDEIFAHLEAYRKTKK